MMFLTFWGTYAYGQVPGNLYMPGQVSNLGEMTKMENNLWEFGSSESWTLMISFRPGWKHFYSMLATGTQLHQGRFFWGLGTGLGTRFALSDYLRISLEASAFQIFEKKFLKDDLDLLASLKIALEGSINHRLSWFVGPTYNILGTRYQYPDDETIWEKFALWTTYSNVSGISRIKKWPGISAGIRF